MAMNLILIHGRAQEKRTVGEIRDEWLQGLRESFARAGLSYPEFPEIRVPYYGDTLAALTLARPAATATVVKRGLDADERFDDFVAAFVEQMARRDGLSDAEIGALLTLEGEAVERGPLNWGWVHSLAQILERRHPWLTNLVLQRIVADVKAYVDFPDVRDAVHAIVEPAIGGDKCIVVAHSLGTVVAYWVLAKLLKEKAKVPLFLTAGSPLGLRNISTKIVPPPRNFPTGVKRWVNLTDKRDIVALTETLDAKTFLPNIENLTDLNNGEDAHSIARYLADPRVAQAIADVI
jgi:hypothetical protein